MYLGVPTTVAAPRVAQNKTVDTSAPPSEESSATAFSLVRGGATTVTITPVGGSAEVIDVIDDGPGVPEDLRGELFKAFGVEDLCAHTDRQELAA